MIRRRIEQQHQQARRLRWWLHSDELPWLMGNEHEMPEHQKVGPPLCSNAYCLGYDGRLTRGGVLGAAIQLGSAFVVVAGEHGGGERQDRR